MDISLSDCEKEQIHIPELIQPHGYVLVFNKNTHIITRYSENFEHLIEHAKDKLIGKRISDVIPSRVYKTIKTKLDFSMYKRHTFFNAVLDQYFEQPIDIIICDAIGEIILELVPNSNIEEDIHSMDIQLNEIVRKVITTQQINSLFDVAAIEIRKLSGYDRVMIYRFDEEFNGEVIAESREPVMESYLNLHYPASDIPAQARELYKTNMIRTIVDMSHSYLRSVSPIHLEYLHNMGVRATLTISIMVNSKLWGLISCHHRTAFSPNIKRLNLVEIFGNILGGIIQAREESENERRSSELLARLDLVMEMLLMHEKSSDSLFTQTMLSLRIIFLFLKMK